MVAVAEVEVDAVEPAEVVRTMVVSGVVLLVDDVAEVALEGEVVVEAVDVDEAKAVALVPSNAVANTRAPSSPAVVGMTVTDPAES